MAPAQPAVPPSPPSLPHCSFPPRNNPCCRLAEQEAFLKVRRGLFMTNSDAGAFKMLCCVFALCKEKDLHQHSQVSPCGRRHGSSSQGRRVLVYTSGLQLLTSPSWVPLEPRSGIRGGGFGPPHAWSGHGGKTLLWTRWWMTQLRRFVLETCVCILSTTHVPPELNHNAKYWVITTARNSVAFGFTVKGEILKYFQ